MFKLIIKIKQNFLKTRKIKVEKLNHNHYNIIIIHYIIITKDYSFFFILFSVTQK